MEKEYLTTAVRVIDLHQDLSFCVSLTSGLDDTYDDLIDLDEDE